MDESFPEPILREAITKRLPELDVRFLKEFEPRLLGVDDHEVIRGLWQAGAAGLVTPDDAMLGLPEVVKMIEQTRFSVVTIRRLGHDGIASSGLFLAHASRIANRHDGRRPQVWRLTAPEASVLHTRELKKSIVGHGGQDPDDFKMSRDELHEPLFP